MTISSSLVYWARVDIACASLTSPSTTTTLKFTNRASKDGNSEYLPLLQSFSGLGLGVDQSGMPRTGSGSIVINDAWESLGYERRIFDIFDRHTAQNQTVTVYEAFEGIDQTDVPSSWTLIYTGKVQRMSKGKDSLTFEVSNDLFPDIKVGRVISSDFALGGSIVPDTSLGKYLPVIFASETSPVLAPAYYIGTDSLGTTFGFAYSVTPNIASDILVKNRDGDYVVCSDFSLPVINLSYTGANAVTSHGKTEFLVPIDFTVDENSVLIEKITWYCKGQNNGAITPTGKIICTLYRQLRGDRTFTKTGLEVYDPSSDLFSWEPLISKEIEKSAYLTQVRGVSTFGVEFTFEIPEPCGSRLINNTERIDDPYVYGIGIVLTEYSGSSTTDFTSANSANASYDYYYRTTDGGGWAKTTSAVPAFLIDVSSITQTLNWLSGNIKGVSFYNNLGIDYSALDVSVLINKAEDDVSGTITGTPSANISRPDHVLKYLQTLVGGDYFDFSTFSYSTIFDGAFYRRVNGFSQGEESFLDIVSTIIKEMSCALVPLSNGKLALYPWGSTSSVSKVYTDAEILNISDIQETDLSTVINNIKLSYGQNFTGTNDQWEATGQAANISNTIIADSTTSGDFANLLRSFQLYGNRELEETTAQFIGDENTALTRVKYLAYRHDCTHRTFEIDASKIDNNSLKVMEIADVLSVHLPAHYGTSNAAAYPTHNGEEVDIYGGEYARRAQRRRCQIIGLNNDYAAESFPTLQIELREIKSRHTEDPTAEDI
jgi:hypothetical protein